MKLNLAVLFILNIIDFYSFDLIEMDNIIKYSSICQSKLSEINHERFCFKVFQNEEQMLGELFARKFATLIDLESEKFPLGRFKKYKIEELKSGKDFKSIDKFNLSNINDLWIMGTLYIHESNPVHLPVQLIPIGHGTEITRPESKMSNIESNSWSELIIFDFLIGNIDRILSHLINHQWNSHIYNYDVPNLGIHNKSVLIHFDNDAAFFHGYRIMEKYKNFHIQLLNQIPFCSKSLINRLEKFSNIDHLQFQRDFQQAKPLKIESSLFDINPNLSLEKISILNSKIKTVLKHCQNLNQH